MRCCVIISLYVLASPIAVKTDFKKKKFRCEIINFHKQSKEPTKHQNLSIAPLRRSILNFNDLDFHIQFFL